MLSKLVTGGTTNIVARKGLYYGAKLKQTPTGVMITIHDASGTASYAAENQIDFLQGGAAAGTLHPSVSQFVNGGERDGVGFMNGLTVWMTAAGTAQIFYD